MKEERNVFVSDKRTFYRNPIIQADIRKKSWSSKKRKQEKGSIWSQEFFVFQLHGLECHSLSQMLWHFGLKFTHKYAK